MIRFFSSLIFFICVTCFANAFQPAFKPVFPDFDQSLKRYGLSNSLYWDFLENPENKNSFSNKKFKKLLNFLYLSNKRVSETERKRQPIPRKIHQIWLGSQVPEKYREWMESWQGWKGWEYKLWTEAEIAEFGLYNQKLYDNAKNYGERSDIARYEILYREGGLYVDVDFQCINPEFFKYAHSNYDLYAGVEPLETLNLSINNALLGFSPKHPLLKAMILELEEHHTKVYDPVLGQFNTIATTGPRYFTKQFQRMELHKDKIDIILPPTFFYPVTWDDCVLPPDEFANFLKPESCAIHWWSGSWHKPGGEVKSPCP